MANAKRKRAKVRSLSGASLLPLLESRLVGEEDVLPISKSGFVRASGFASMCPREEVFCALDNVVRKNRISPTLGLYFQHGSALHYWAQNHLIGKLEGVFFGKWSCTGCGLVFGGEDDQDGPGGYEVVSRPSFCKSCGSESFLYKELDLENKEFKITGHADGFLNLEGKKGLGVLELKSISSFGIAGIKNVPDISHFIQLQLYMWLVGLNWGVILYWNKGGKGIDAFIEHFVEKDASIIEDVKGTLSSMWSAIEGEGPIPDRLCENMECARASKCVVKELCFKEGLKELEEEDFNNEDVSW